MHSLNNKVLAERDMHSPHRVRIKILAEYALPPYGGSVSRYWPRRTCTPNTE